MTLEDGRGGGSLRRGGEREALRGVGVTRCVELV
jgi:hypothetical protein